VAERCALKTLQSVRRALYTFIHAATKMNSQIESLELRGCCFFKGALLSFKDTDFDAVDIAFSHISVLDLEYLVEASGDELFRCVRSMALLESCV